MSAGVVAVSPTPGWRTSGAVFLVLLLAAGSLFLVVVPRTFHVAPADGIVYVDAFHRALQGQVTVRGDLVGDTALDEAACRQPSLPADSLQWDCDPESGRQSTWRSTAWIHPPTSFFADAALTRAVGVVAPNVNPLDIGRLIGALWFALGGLLIVLLASAWGARPWAAAAVMLALLPTPLFVDTFAFVTPDRWVLIVGAGALLAATLWWRHHLAVPWLGVVGVVCGGLVKQTFLLAAATAMLLLVLLWWQDRRSRDPSRTGREVGGALVWLGGGAAVGAVLWQLAKISWGQPAAPAAAPDFLTLPARPDTALSLLFHGAWQIPMNDSAAVALEPMALLGISALMTLLLAGAAWGALFYRQPSEPGWPMAAAGVIAIGIGGLVVGVMGTLSGGAWLPSAPRYVMPAFAAYAVPLIVLAHRRWLLGLMWALAAIGALSWAFAPLL